MAGGGYTSNIGWRLIDVWAWKTRDTYGYSCVTRFGPLLFTNLKSERVLPDDVGSDYADVST